jgi:hypothetical protein
MECESRAASAFRAAPSGDQLPSGTTKEALQHGTDTLGYPSSAFYAPSAEVAEVFSQTPDAHAEFRGHKRHFNPF